MRRKGDGDRGGLDDGYVPHANRSDQNGRQRRINTKEKALKIAEEFERVAKIKRTRKQVKKVLDRLHEKVLRTTAT
jgi:hypothetical protein